MKKNCKVSTSKAEHLFRVANLICTKSPVAIVGIKHTLNGPKNKAISQGLVDIGRTNMSQIFTVDVQNAITASFAKTSATYQKL